MMLFFIMILIVAAGGYFLFFRKKGDEDPYGEVPVMKNGVIVGGVRYNPIGITSNSPIPVSIPTPGIGDFFSSGSEIGTDGDIIGVYDKLFTMPPIIGASKRSGDVSRFKKEAIGSCQCNDDRCCFKGCVQGKRDRDCHTYCKSVNYGDIVSACERAVQEFDNRHGKDFFKDENVKSFLDDWYKRKSKGKKKRKGHDKDDDDDHQHHNKKKGWYRHKHSKGRDKHKHDKDDDDYVKYDRDRERLDRESREFFSDYFDLYGKSYPYKSVQFSEGSIEDFLGFRGAVVNARVARMGF